MWSGSKSCITIVQCGWNVATNYEESEVASFLYCKMSLWYHFICTTASKWPMWTWLHWHVKIRASSHNLGQILCFRKQASSIVRDQDCPLLRDQDFPRLPFTASYTVLLLVAACTTHSYIVHIFSLKSQCAVMHVHMSPQDFICYFLNNSCD